MKYILNIKVVALNVDTNFVTYQRKARKDSGWLVVKVDGGKSAVSTPLVSIQQRMSFNFQTSIPYESNDNMQSYVYFTLCVFGKSQRENIPIAKCRSRIGRLPLNGAVQFDLPLISGNQQVAVINLSGVLQSVGAANPQVPPPMQVQPPPYQYAQPNAPPPYGAPQLPPNPKQQPAPPQNKPSQGYIPSQPQYAPTNDYTNPSNNPYFY
ncbi:hypothetical protein GPJ56_004647 [Histomonas meleagridis]|uniref:uncharacterized protein n=1 Tax=Histomonas meleagridis TaxID=135588 RepID=UPI00355A797F|nr:hypothetical protein GPJ56_004647 [Histomonas meleagridis]KAH0797409.1 hypothetical protein GO595_009730 [Histomonas meleagridis]